LAEQIGQWKLGVLPAPRIGQVLGDEITKLKRSSSSRTRIRPPSEVTRDPWKSTFNEALKEAEMARFVFHPLGVDLQSVFIVLKPHK